MATYSPPTRVQLRGEVAQDLRDTALTTFLPAEIDDFVNEGIAELNAVKPVEALESYPVEVDDGLGNITIDTGSYIVGLSDIFNVELTVPGVDAIVIPHNANDLIPRERNGWDLFAGRLRLSVYWGRVVERYEASYPGTGLAISAWGYALRDPLTTDAQVAEFDLEDEHFVRVYARMRGFERLSQDRSLFQQWQTQTNNSDVSATQLTNMAQGSESEISRLRRRMYVIRRPVMAATG
jgi:hypothetical protein